MSGKRIVFSTATPNDQGGIIPNDCIDFARYNVNPVILCQHNWYEPPLGLMTDIKIENGKWTGVPVFHKITKESQEYAAMYEKGFLRACSIGGDAVWKKNAANQTFYDKNGNRVCEKFYLYEISMVSLPANMDAVQDGPVELSETDLASMLNKPEYLAKVFDHTDMQQISEKLVTLSSQFNKLVMKTEEKPAAEAAKPAEVVTLTTEKPAAEAAKPAAETAKLETIVAPADELPAFMKNIVGFMSQIKEILMGGAGVSNVLENAPKATIPANAGSKTPTTQPAAKAADAKQPTPTGLSVDEELLNTARLTAEKAVEEAFTAKAAAEKTGATQTEKDAYTAKAKIALEAIAEVEKLEAKAKEKPKEDDETEEEAAADGKEKETKEKTKNSAKMKTTAQLMADKTVLAPKPEHQAKVIGFGNSIPFSKLSSDKEGQRILNNVMAKDAGQKDIAEYAIVLNSILADGKFAALKDKVRFMQNVNEAQLQAYQSTPGSRTGLSLTDLAAKLNRGECSVMTRSNTMETRTTLTATDDFLASPDLLAIEFLPLAIFKLFPDTSWKKDIPLFGATETGNNTGLIFANIAADPAITKGTKPVSPTDYTYSDTAVALKLVPYWLQPMLWEPLTMHQLRYDQMTTGWAQAFAKWGAVMDDEMIYTLASTVPASSIVQSSGGLFYMSGAADPNSWYYNPDYTGNLKKPAFNDIMRLEQIYNKQNFALESERATLVLDPTMDSLISQDPDTKSLLTRWVDSGKEDFFKIKHTLLPMRSRVAIYDPATGLVKDPMGVIPSTAVSAGVGFIPSNVGMGLGMLDVFMIQDPSAYGYKMSADIRIGITPLRANYNGTTLYTYGAADV